MAERKSLAALFVCGSKGLFDVDENEEVDDGNGGTRRRFFSNKKDREVRFGSDSGSSVRTRTSTSSGDTSGYARKNSLFEALRFQGRRGTMNTKEDARVFKQELTKLGPRKRRFRNSGDYLELVTLQALSLNEATYNPTAYSKTVAKRNDLKQRAVVEARKCYLLDRECRELDNKIRLLVRNRITLQEALAAQAGLFSRVRTNPQSLAFVKIKHDYERLFELLHRNVNYLALLSRACRGGDIDFMTQMVVFSIFGDQYEPREDHRLLALFEKALDAEAQATAPGEVGSFLRSRTCFTDMVGAYTRRRPAMAALRQILGDTVLALEKADEELEINPMKIYEGVNKEASEQARGTPMEEVAKKPEVAAVMKPRIKRLCHYAEIFLMQIVNNINAIPYGLRFICKQVDSVVTSRFGLTEKTGKQSLIGGFIYLRFFSPALATPDHYGLLDHPPSPKLRRNLILIAKLLQNLSNNTLYGDKEKYLVPLNDYLQSKKGVMTGYFRRVIEVEDLSTVSEADKYMGTIDLAEITVPTTVSEMYRLHGLIEKHIDEVVPNDSDPLRTILQQIGPAPPSPEGKDNFHVSLTIATDKSLDVANELEDEEFSSYHKARGLLLNILPQLQPLYASNTVELIRELKTQMNTLSAASSSKAVDIRKSVSLLLGLLESIHAGRPPSSRPDEVEEEDYIFIKLLKDLSDDLDKRDFKMNELNANIRNLEEAVYDLNGKYEVLQERAKTFQSYLENVRATVLRPKSSKKNKGVKDELTLRMSYSEMEKRGVIVESKVPHGLRKRVNFEFSTSRPGVVDVTAFFTFQEVMSISIEMEDLLERQQNKEKHYDCEEVVLNIDSLIQFLNKKFYGNK